MYKATDERRRLEALRGYGLLDTPPEPEFEALVQEAAARFAMPIALVSLVDENRQWFKAAVGLDASETPRSMSFCAHAIRGGGVFVVADALTNTTFQNNPLVQGNPHIRFYAGAPIETQSGHRLGTICVIDQAPRERFAAHQKEALAQLARRAMALIEARKQADAE